MGPSRPRLRLVVSYRAADRARTWSRVPDDHDPFLSSVARAHDARYIVTTDEDLERLTEGETAEYGNPIPADELGKLSTVDGQAAVRSTTGRVPGSVDRSPDRWGAFGPGATNSVHLEILVSNH